MTASASSGATDSALSIFRAASEQPNGLALVADGEPWTFARLAHRVAAASRWLDERLGEAATEKGFAVLADRRFETLCLIYAAIELGYPMTLLHPRWTAEERQHFAHQLGHSSIVDAGELPVNAKDEHWTPRSVSPERILARVPTSGSSSRPKAVALSRRAFAAAAKAHTEHLGWQPHDRWLLSLPLAHVGGLSILIRCLAARRAVVMRSTGESFNADQIRQRVEADGLTILSLVPAMLKKLQEHGPPPAGLRLVMVGGAPMLPNQLATARRAGWPALATYGLTEACAQVATQPLADLEAPGKPRSGAPLLPGLEARIDSEGRLAIRGPTLMSGYVSGGEPANGHGLDAEGWLPTNDLAEVLDDGRLKILGRLDRVIITGGENVQPVAVERALLELPILEAACVVGVQDPHWGQAVAAMVVAAPGIDPTTLDLAGIRRAVASSLADFQRPRQLLVESALPTTASGKIDPQAVRRRFEQAPQR